MDLLAKLKDHYNVVDREIEDEAIFNEIIERLLDTGMTDNELEEAWTGDQVANILADYGVDDYDNNEQEPLLTEGEMNQMDNDQSDEDIPETDISVVTTDTIEPDEEDTLFDAIMEMEPAQREAFLARFQESSVSFPDKDTPGDYEERKAIMEADPKHQAALKQDMGSMKNTGNALAKLIGSLKF